MRISRHHLVLTLFAFATILILAPAAAHAARVGVPERGVLIGADIGAGESSNQAAMADFNLQAGKRHAFFHRFVNPGRDAFNGNGYSYSIEDFCNAATNVGAVPYLTVEPYRASSSSLLTEEDVAWLKRFAGDIGRWGKPVLIRFAHEMNGTWYPWGYTHVSPQTYVGGFRTASRVLHDYAPNVGVVWAPNQNWGPDADDLYSRWYPGDSYVDWVGLSAYHWYNNSPHNDQFARYLTQGEGPEGNFYETFAVGHGKPMILTETACGDDYYRYYDNRDYAGRPINEAGVYGTAVGQGAQNWWIRQIYKVGSSYPAVNASFPMLKAIVWYGRTSSSGTIDFQITGSDPARHAVDFSTYRAAVADPYFRSDATGPSTTLELTPARPNGRYGWYVTRPVVKLSSRDGNRTLYRWGPTGPFSDYAGPLTAWDGRRGLYYYSAGAAGISEATNRLVLSVDTSSPTISSLSVLPRAFSPRLGRRTRVRYFLADNVSSRMTVSVLVYNRAGRFVRRLGPSWKNAGSGSTVWNGRDARGRYVHRGTYWVRIVVRDVAGNRRDSSRHRVYVR